MAANAAFFSAAVPGLRRIRPVKLSTTSGGAAGLEVRHAAAGASL